MCEYMWQICCCSSSLMLSSFAQDSDLSIHLPKIVIPEPRCLQGHSSVSLSDHFLPWSSTGRGAPGTSCLGSWQILPPNFLVQGSQVRWQSGICTRSFLPWGQSTMWSSSIGGVASASGWDNPVEHQARDLQDSLLPNISTKHRINLVGSPGDRSACPQTVPSSTVIA